MPKLNDETAKAVEETESTGGLMEIGTYRFVLESVEVKDGAKGPYWAWTFKRPEDETQYKGWKQWLNTSLSADSMWKLKEVFEGFGVSPDTDTDELIGEEVYLFVDQQTAQAGKRQGELVNYVKSVTSKEDAANLTTEMPDNVKAVKTKLDAKKAAGSKGVDKPLY